MKLNAFCNFKAWRFRWRQRQIVRNRYLFHELWCCFKFYQQLQLILINNIKFTYKDKGYDNDYKYYYE